jgi:hypothetical protein
MKDLRTLLLGSAAGLVAVTAAHAADLPVKDKSAGYLKVCSLYGAGFYYVAGTDLCLKIGGWVRVETAWGGNGTLSWGPFNGNVNNRLTSNDAVRERGNVTADARNQTEYGTARAYIAVGILTNDTGLQVTNLVDFVNRAFVQWAGMTAGLAESFYDFYSSPAVAYRIGYLPSSFSGDSGWWVWAYTAQFGGGLAGTISMEGRRTTQIIDANALPGPAGTAVLAGGGTIIPGGYPCAATITATGAIVAGTSAGGCSTLSPGNGAYGGFQAPDVVANLRVDQAWGGAQVMGALHEVNASYYSAANALQSAPSTTGAGGVGHPGDKWGWAAGFGLKINTPFISQGDWFQTQVNVTQGALRYLFNTPNSNWGKVETGKEAFGVLSDCVYAGVVAVGNNTGCMLTSAWGFNAGYEHYWTPAWHTSLYGAYYQVSYGKGTGSANSNLCSAAGFGTLTGSLAGTLAQANPGCNMDWSTWGVGTRTQWDVTKTFYLGVEVLYSQLHSAQTGTGSVVGPAGFASFASGGATVNESNASNWAITLRAHRDFLP